MMPQTSLTLGFLRSWFIYRGIPGRRRRLRRFYRQFLHSGELAFDLGAHVGSRISCWRELGVRVLAIEPQSLFFSYLQRKFNQDPDVVLLQIGVADHKGSMSLMVSDRTPTVSSLSHAWTKNVQTDSRFSQIVWNRTESVAVDTLDNLIRLYGVPKFCKIDVEGFEFEVLSGLTQAISVVSFEFIPVQKVAAIRCLRRLAELGNYEFNLSYREEMKLKFGAWRRIDEAIDILENMPMDRPSGDVYARLR